LRRRASSTSKSLRRRIGRDRNPNLSNRRQPRESKTPMPPPNKNACARSQAGHTQEVSLVQDNRAPEASAQAREILFHALATQHLQRVRIIELLTEIGTKLDALLDAVLSGRARLP
jgi:hypothetical protein